MDAKRLLVLLLAFYVEILHHYFVFKRNMEERDKTIKVTIYIWITNLSTRTFSPVRANAIS